MKRIADAHRAFTLVELLVVIGIIGVLVGILLPALAKSRETANDIACRANLQQIALATKMYENDYKDRIPDGYTLGGSQFRRGRGQVNPNDPTSVPEVYGPGPLYYTLGYLKNDSIWICPSQNEIMKSFRNTYQVAIAYGGATPYDSDYRTSKLRGKRGNENVWWIGDDVQYNPFTSGVRKGPSDPIPTIASALQNYPHKYRARSRYGTGRKGSINMCFIDGQVGVVVFNLDTGNNEVLRSP